MSAGTNRGTVTCRNCAFSVVCAETREYVECHLSPAQVSAYFGPIAEPFMMGGQPQVGLNIVSTPPRVKPDYWCSHGVEK